MFNKIIFVLATSLTVLLYQNCTEFQSNTFENSAITSGSGGNLGGDGRDNSADKLCRDMSQLPAIELSILNKDEYNNTVNDLFNVTSLPADNLPTANTGAFDTTNSNVKFDIELMELYFNMSEKVAEEAQSKNANLFACSGAQNQVCAEILIRDLGLKLYRRPLTTVETNGLIQVYLGGRTDNNESFSEAMGNVLQAMLISPQFLYKTVSDKGSSSFDNLDAFELATRLSYFLWSSTPDSVLLQKAANGSLLSNQTLVVEVKRMMKDVRAKKFTNRFFYQWLELKKFEDLFFDLESQPKFTAQLKKDLFDETRVFFEKLIENDAPVKDIISANYTYINSNLANHYGLSGQQGNSFARVPLPVHKRGVLSHGSLLAKTSHADETSIILRGVLVLNNFLCTQIPPPPDTPMDENPDIVDTKVGRAEHRASVRECSICHDSIDPIGFGLESYDQLGNFRTKENGEVIKANGELPSGASFSTITELATAMDQGSQFSKCFSRNLASFAIGRDISRVDSCSINDFTDVVDQNKRISDLIISIVQSPLFKARTK